MTNDVWFMFVFFKHNIWDYGWILCDTWNLMHRDKRLDFLRKSSRFLHLFFFGGGEKMDSDILFLWGGGVWNVTTGMWNCFGVFWCFMSLCLVDYDGWCLTSMVGVCDFCLIFWFVWWGVWLVWFIILCVWMIEGTLERSEWRGMMWMFDWWIGQWFRFLKRWVERSVFFLGGMSGWWEEVSLI